MRTDTECEVESCVRSKLLQPISASPARDLNPQLCGLLRPSLFVWRAKTRACTQRHGVFPSRANRIHGKGSGTEEAFRIPSTRLPDLSCFHASAFVRAAITYKCSHPPNGLEQPRRMLLTAADHYVSAKGHSCSRLPRKL